jgi:hypothetical protein
MTTTVEQTNAAAAESSDATEESKIATNEIPVDSPTSVEESKLTTSIPSAPAASSQAERDASSSSKTPLSRLLEELPNVVKEAEYQEIWGIQLADSTHVPTTIVLEKFLRANAKDVPKAKAQLIEALKWRKKMQPIKLLAETEFDSAKFGGLGYVTTYPKSETHGKEIVTWNIYGAVKDNKATFGNVEE